MTSFPVKTEVAQVAPSHGDHIHEATALVSIWSSSLTTDLRLQQRSVHWQDSSLYSPLDSPLLSVVLRRSLCSWRHLEHSHYNSHIVTVRSSTVKMFRTTAARAVPKSLTTFRTTSTRTPLTKFTQQAAFRTSTRAVKTSPLLALAVQQPLRKSLVRYASGGGSQVIYGQDPEAEKSLQTQKIVAVPEEVSSTSSVHKAFQEKGVEEQEQDVDMMAGIRSDFVRV